MANEWAKLSTANLEMLKLIPEKKPVLDVMHNGTSALVAAHEDIDLVKLLLEVQDCHCFSKQQSKRRKIALNSQSITALPLSAKDTDGCTALLTAARSGSIAACRILLDAGAQPNTFDSKGITSYIRSQSWPCAYCESAAETKCESQFDVQKILAKHGNFEIVQLLVVNGAVGQPTPYEKWKRLSILG